MPDEQLIGMAHAAITILSKKNDGKYDGARTPEEKAYYYMQRCVRYMTDPEFSTPEGFKDMIDPECIDDLIKALKVIDDIVNY